MFVTVRLIIENPESSVINVLRRMIDHKDRILVAAILSLISALT